MMTENNNMFFDHEDIRHKGAGVIIGDAVRLRYPERTTIEDHSIIDDFTYVSCELIVGRYTHIGAGSVLLGGGGTITIGDFVNIGPGARLVSASHNFYSSGLVGPCLPKGVGGEADVRNIIVGDHVLLGVGVMVMPGVVFPEGAAVGAGSLVQSSVDLEPWSVYFGTPCRKVGLRSVEPKREAERFLREGAGP